MLGTSLTSSDVANSSSVGPGMSPSSMTSCNFAHQVSSVAGSPYPDVALRKVDSEAECPAASSTEVSLSQQPERRLPRGVVPVDRHETNARSPSLFIHCRPWDFQTGHDEDMRSWAFESKNGSGGTAAFAERRTSSEANAPGSRSQIGGSPGSGPPRPVRRGEAPSGVAPPPSRYGCHPGATNGMCAIKGRCRTRL